MNLKIFVFFIIFALAFFPPEFAYAESTNNYIHIGMGIQDFGYKEFNEQGVLLNREDGLVPGVKIEMGKNWQDFSGELCFKLFDGVVDYDGQTQSGIPLRTDTDERIITFEGLLRYKLRLSPQNNANLIAGIGHREWRRDIRGTGIVSGLFEIYRWKYLIVGGAATFWQKGKWSAGIDVRWLRPIRPTMMVDIVGYDEVTLDLESRSSARVNFPIRIFGTYEREWTISPYWESWRLGRSDDEQLTINGVPTPATVHEPRSKTNIVGLTVSVKL